MYIEVGRVGVEWAEFFDNFLLNKEEEKYSYMDLVVGEVMVVMRGGERIKASRNRAYLKAAADGRITFLLWFLLIW